MSELHLLIGGRPVAQVTDIIRDRELRFRHLTPEEVCSGLQQVHGTAGGAALPPVCVRLAASVCVHLLTPSPILDHTAHTTAHTAVGAAVGAAVGDVEVICPISQQDLDWGGSDEGGRVHDVQVVESSRHGPLCFLSSVQQHPESHRKKAQMRTKMDRRGHIRTDKDRNGQMRKGEDRKDMIPERKPLD